MVKAVWIPGWYELDQPLEVGQSGEFAFWREVPDYLRGPESLVLYNTLWNPIDVLIGQGTISAIHHPELGAIRRVDTQGLVYTITMNDGRKLSVEGEETPGEWWEWINPTSEAAPMISGWRFIVEFESLSDLVSPS